uniref:Uncharacterized protein n=1 Tax=Phytophthora ramorum TaxID=164328 RepID=H3GKL2_PHYRM
MATTMLALAGCTNALPSLKLGFNIKRPSLAVHGATTFDIFVTPVVSGDNVAFNGKATIEQDGATHNFYLVNNVPYHEVINTTVKTVTCQTPNVIPSVSNVVEAIASAFAVSSVNTDQDISCTNGTWLSTTFAGESYVLCTGTGSGSNNFVVYGEDMSIAFEYLSESLVIMKPTNAPTTCDIVTDGTLLQKACDAAMNVSTGNVDTDSTVINDLIIVAHSMGNNMLASALADDRCSIGRNVDWVDLSGPMKGSMGSDFIHEICDGDDNGDPDVWSKLGGLIGQCPGSTTRRSLVYDGGDYCDDEMSARYAASRAMHEKYVTAGVCGTTFNGLLSKEYAGLLAGGLIIPHHSRKNDGVVEFQSCIGGLDASLFDTTYKSTWYAAKLNHADTTFHDGDALFSKAQKPLKWFECLL